MRALVGALIGAVTLAGCVTAPTGAAKDTHSCVTTITGPDGKPQQAVIEADDAGAAALLCEGGVPMAAPTPVSAPTPAPVQSRPAGMAGDNPLVHRRIGGPGCGLRMVGGTGYVCATR